MQNFIQPGEVVSLPAPYDRLSGQGALIGSIFGVAKVTVLSGVSADFLLEGVVELAKTSAQAWTVGDRIYWDDTNKRLDNVATVGPLVGAAVLAAANPSSTGRMRMLMAPSDNVTTAAIAQVATADATDLATSEALANALKAKLNTLLTQLHTALVIG